MKAVFMIMALALTGCSGWRVVGTTPASAEPFPESVRVTLHDGSRSILRKPLLRMSRTASRPSMSVPVDSVARIAVPAGTPEGKAANLGGGIAVATALAILAGMSLAQ